MWQQHGASDADLTYDLRVAVPFILIFVILIIRPQGLFGRKVVVRV